MRLKISGFFIVLMGLVLAGCLNPVNPQPSSAKAITSFSFESLSATGSINETVHTIAVTVPSGTDVTALTPTISYSGVSISPASGVAQNFTNTVIYTVTAQDATTQEYTVKVAPITAKAITAFSFTNPAAAGSINETSHTIAVTVPYGTDVTALTPTISYTGTAISPASDVVRDFINPVIYTVTAGDSTAQEYTVTVTVAPITAKAITAFSFTNPAATGSINETSHTIAVTVPYGTDVTALTPTITHTGTSISPASGTAQDFTNPVTYTVTAGDKSTQNYTVTVELPFLVTFDSQGGSSVPSQEVFAGGSVTEPAFPTKNGNGFGGWYKDSTYQNLWDFSLDTVNSGITLHAKWYAATDGLAYTLINANTEYEVTQGTASSVSVITIPDYWNGKKVTSIGNSGFQGCAGLTSITIPSGVTSVGIYAFYACSSLTSIALPSGVITIANQTFSYCSNLVSISIPSSVTAIGDSAFYGCSSLTSIILPSGVTTIGGSAFNGCSSLTSIILPSGVTTIGGSALSGCSSLTSIALPSGVTSIGGNAFYGCSGLTSLSMEPLTAPILGSTVFGNVSGCTLHISSNTTTGYDVSPWIDNPPFSSIAADLP